MYFLPNDNNKLKNKFVLLAKFLNNLLPDDGARMKIFKNNCSKFVLNYKARNYFRIRTLGHAFSEFLK